MAKDKDETMSSFIRGSLLGLLVSVPVAVWKSPRNGREMRAAIWQRVTSVPRGAGRVLSKPIDAIQQQVEDLRGESVAESLAEGRSLAQQRTGRHDLTG